MTKKPKSPPVKKPRAKTLFTRRDVVRAVRATRQAGEQVRAVEVTKQGAIRIMVGDAAADNKDEWDEAISHGKDKAQAR
jgi:hypothetical protein